ncbi:hypothetical protein HOI26_05505 [Candidatus Woesearchaeota archaeon]|jgi:hypothetical protein|nr:hypothetical protein [Candidatus Woesearchaeota archaeon]MBT5740523.1 hypothetical protein [Candidatus Woesearchaeota archaeon]
MAIPTVNEISDLVEKVNLVTVKPENFAEFKAGAENFFADGEFLRFTRNGYVDRDKEWEQYNSGSDGNVIRLEKIDISLSPSHKNHWAAIHMGFDVPFFTMTLNDQKTAQYWTEGNKFYMRFDDARRHLPQRNPGDEGVYVKVEL